MTSPADTDLQARLARALAPSFELESELGRGGMAIVYRGRDTRLKRGVAVKLLPPDLAFRADIRSRFLREAETAARLSHPNIVPIYAVDERDGLVYFVMALVNGESVGDRLRKIRVFPVEEARRIIREVADALAYAHQHGVVHRDIKPDNILLDAQSGRAMVTDFGIARAASEDGDARLTATGTAIGTPAYMSPEQCAGDREIDGRSDLYSLGTVAYQMLSGDPPFTGGNTPSMMMKQVTEPPVAIQQRRPDLPVDLAAIIMRLLEKDPARRFANGAELVAALDGHAVPAPSAERRREPARSVGASAEDKPGFDKKLMLEVGVIAAKRSITERAMRRQERFERRQLRKDKKEAKEARPLPERVRAFRRRFVSIAGTTVFLFGINAMTSPDFWWAVFPMLGMGLGLVKEMGNLWSDGVRLGAMFSGDLPPQLAAPAVEAAPSPPALYAGPHAAVLRQAEADRRSVHDLVARLTDTERKMIPDMKGTADALYDRIVALAPALDRLDEQIGGNRGAALDARIAEIEKSAGDATDRERRLSLLKRQRDMLAELVRSRERLHEQFESAGILLQNLALDLLKVRSSGLDSALGGMNNATQEARALAKEIGYVLDAADELRDLEGNGNRKA